MNVRFKSGALALLFLLALATPGAIAATPSEGPIWIEEYEFVSATENFQYNDAPPTIREGNRVYTKTGEIVYEKIGDAPIYSTVEEEVIRDMSKLALAAQNDALFPETITVDDQGDEATLQRQNIQWSERTQEGKTSTHYHSVDYGLHTAKPEAVSSIEIELHGEKQSMELAEVRQTTLWAWEPNHIATVTLLAEDGMALDSDKPQWQGKESAILDILHLEPLHYILRDAKWAQSANGGDMRAAVFTLDRYVARFCAVYQCQIKAADTTLYDGKAIYSGKVSREVQTGLEYKVKAKVTYQAAPDPLTPSPVITPSPSVSPLASPVQEKPLENEEKSRSIPVIATVGASIGVAGGAIWFFFYFRKRRDNHAAVQ